MATNDHDLVIRIDTKVDLLTRKVDDLVSGTTNKISDLERRVNTLEVGRKENQDGIDSFKVYMGIVVSVGLVLAGLLVYHITGGQFRI